MIALLVGFVSVDLEEEWKASMFQTQEKAGHQGKCRPLGSWLQDVSASLKPVCLLSTYISSPCWGPPSPPPPLMRCGKSVEAQQSDLRNRFHCCSRFVTSYTCPPTAAIELSVKVSRTLILNCAEDGHHGTQFGHRGGY